MKEKIKNRYNILAALLFVVCLLFALQLFNLQVINGAQYDEDSQQRVLSERKIVAPRGDIVDRNGVPIAVNRIGFTVQIINTKLKNDALNDMLLRLVKSFEKNGDSYYKSLDKYLTYNPIAYGKAINKSDKESQKWKSEMVLNTTDLKGLNSPRQVFDYFRNVKFEISKKYTDQEAYKIMTMRYELLMRGFSTLRPMTIAKDVSKETVAQIDEMHHSFPGVTTDVQPMRKYIDADIVSHILGYVGIVDKEIKGYGLNDIIGKTGIELEAEKELKGTDGLKRVEVDTNGRLTEVLDTQPAVPGNDVVLTIDMNLQKVAMESLKKNIEKIRNISDRRNKHDAFAGAAVALDVNTGEVLAMASYPSYDPSIFLENSENKDAQKKIVQLINDSVNKPMRNRAIQDIYSPGSTFKPLTAISALQEGVITPQTIIYDSGSVVIGGRRFVCMEYRDGYGAHGALNLERALATSCNIFFHIIGYNTRIANIDKWGKMFGLGQKTGIDLPYEERGVLASIKNKELLHPDDPVWRPADTAMASIGQDDNSFTPLQIANYISTLANGGKRYKPHLIKKVVGYNGSFTRDTKIQYVKVPANDANINAVKDGMLAVTNTADGTAAKEFDDLKQFGIEVAGKTGTAETGAESSHSSNALFVCYAPADKPKIAVAVVVERGVWGSYTAPIAHDILKEYFNLNEKIVTDDSIKTDEAALTR